MSLILLANFDSQSVSIVPNDEIDSSVWSESAASDGIRELEEDVKPVPTNEITVVLTYNSEKKRYEGQLETNKETGIGTWSLTKTVGVGENNVSNVLEIKILITEESVLKKGSFKLIPHLATLFDLSSIKVEPNRVKVGEKLRFSLHSAKDDLLTNVMVAYRLLSIDGETADQQLTLSLAFNEENKAYEGKLPSIINQLVSDYNIFEAWKLEDFLFRLPALPWLFPRKLIDSVRNLVYRTTK